MRVSTAVILLFSLAAQALAAAPPTRPAPLASSQVDFFERRVRPVLSEACVRCHGPKKQMGGLRLDTRAGLFQGGDSGPAIVSGRPEDSRLVQAIRHSGDLKMPPKTPLPPSAVADLAAWVRAGAPWPEDRPAPGGEDWKRHWAFRPVADGPPPAVKTASWPRTSLDRFVLAKLESKGLSPSPEADKQTLIRRLSFDLSGLPPTPEEMRAFVEDSSPDAYEKLVERLLASPRYGERWARYWLDVARFADTKGYVFFQEAAYPWAYTYRDYVIEAFNEDRPYDQFVREQLAADLIPGANKKSLRALGFLTLGGRFMNNVHDILDDQIDVVTRGLLGLTVGCARCHDHKFDPIPTKDYYSLYGVFASCVEPEVPPLFAPEPATPAYVAFAKELEKRKQNLAEFVRVKQSEVKDGARTRAAEYLLAAHARRGQPSTEEFMLIADGADINPAMLKRWQAYLERSARSQPRVWAPWHAFAALPEKEFALRAEAVVAELRTGLCGGQPVNPFLARKLCSSTPKSLKEVATAYSAVLNATEAAWKEAPASSGRMADPDQEELRLVFHGPAAPPDVPPGLINDLDLLPDRPSQGRLQELRKKVETWRATGPGAPPRAHALVDRLTPVEPSVFKRGNPGNPGEVVPRRFLSALSGPDNRPFTKGSGRRELAEAITSAKNPLTARVLVNRVWLHHFGRGLVTTPGDFGLRGEPPSHPELLDHLASQFVQDGYSLKKLHRSIVLSAAYRQQSDDRPECRKADPENVLLWRMNRQRLDFEATRDALLAVTGQLDSTLGGPSLKDILSPGSRRRTLYGYVDRLQVPGLYRSFDFPSADSSSPRRDQTTVPQQALFLMNNPFVLQAARGLLGRPEVSGEKDIATKVGRLYRMCYAREPNAEELALAREFLGAGKPEEQLRYAQALLLANEFVFVD